MNKLIYFLLIILSISLLNAAFVKCSEKVLPEHPDLGLATFKEKNCIGCHSIWNTGGNIGPDLSVTLSQKSFFQIIGLLWNHFPRMSSRMKEEGIPVAKTNAEDIENLIVYLYNLNFYDEPGNCDIGEKLFDEKHCSTCHSLGVSDSRDKIPLDKFGWMISPAYLATEMWNHRPNMKPILRQKHLDMPMLGEKDLSHIVSYIRGKSIDESENRQYLMPGNPNNGKKIFEKIKCNSCHSVLGEGGKKGPDLSTRELSVSISVLLSRIWNHLDRMENIYRNIDYAFPHFEPQEMADLLSYLYFINFYDFHGDVLAGEAVFQEKGCAKCHSTGGKNDNLPMNLSFSSVDFESFDFAALIWNHIEKMGEMFEEEMIAWPNFTDNEMRDLIFYLRDRKNK